MYCISIIGLTCYSFVSIYSEINCKLLIIRSVHNIWNIIALIWKEMCGKFTWLFEKLVCGLRFLNKLHEFVLKKFCVGWYVKCAFSYGILLFHSINSHSVSSAQNLPGIPEVFTKILRNKVHPNMLILTTTHNTTMDLIQSPFVSQAVIMSGTFVLNV